MNPTEYYRRERHPYYIYAPGFREESSGVRVLHYLCHILNLKGYEAYIHTNVTNEALWTPVLDDGIVRKHYDNKRKPIIVYPEIIKGAPLGFGIKVRYLLNTPGYFTGHSSFGSDEIIVAYLEAFIGDTGTENILLIPASDPNKFNPHGTDPRNRHGRYYFYNRLIKKGGKLLPVTDGAIEMSPAIPRSLDELASIFRTAELLYCYEISAIAQEARLCGCPVVYVPNQTMLPEDPRGQFGLDGAAWGTSEDAIAEAKATVHKVFSDYIESYKKFEIQLQDFISLTQNAAENTAFHECYPPLTVIQKGWPLYPDAETLNPLENGIQLYQSGLYEHAISFLKTAVENNNTDAQANLYLSLSCAAVGLVSEAEIFIRQAMSSSYSRPEFFAALGEQFLKSDNPALALHYLEIAVETKPDLLAAYPALAEALRLAHRSDEAIQLLVGAASIDTGSQSAIRQSLEEILITRGDIESLASLYLRGRSDPGRHSLAIRLQTQLGTPQEILFDSLNRFLEFLPATGQAISSRQPNPDHALLKVGFIVSDFQREASLGRLEAVLTYLPSAQFETSVFDNDPHAPKSELAQRCNLLADHWLRIHSENDEACLQSLHELDLDILIDLDGHGPGQRLGLLFAADVPFRATWNDTSLPLCFDGSVQLIGGESIIQDRDATLLPGTGELYCLPDILPTSTKPHRQSVTFGCLTAAIRINHETWQVYARLLSRVLDSQLVVNLAELGEPAREFITGIFERNGISQERLIFIQATDTKAICECLNEIDIGLAPLHGHGGIALPACLWMNVPFIALDADVSWSRRPTALLRTVECPELIASNTDDFLAIATRLALEKQDYSFLRQRFQEQSATDPKYFAELLASRLHNACAGSKQ